MFFWIIHTVLSAVIMTIALGLAVKATALRARRGSLPILGIMAALLLTIPYIGWILALACLFYMSCRLIDAPPLPDIAALVIIAWVIAWLGRFILLTPLRWIFH